jgi:uracil-DNA glycosylase
MVKIEESWAKLMSEEFEKDYFKRLIEFVKKEYQCGRCFPPGALIFRAFDLCSVENTKVVIIGQDPYHGLGQAHGLCFSVNSGIAFPPSLLNIFKELESDLGLRIPSHGDLSHWAKQGVLLLNATLTVKENMAGSHQNQGWEQFTDAVISLLNQKKKNLVFMLWGNFAQKKASLVDRDKHFVLKSAHPSPLSANRGGWFGNRHFSQANTFLKAKGESSINWG